ESDQTGYITAEYLFFDGKRLARVDNPASASTSASTTPPAPTLQFYFSDHLGSTGMVSSIDDNGQVTIEIKYNPLAAGSSHSFIVVTDRDGTQYVFRAGPSLGAGGFSRSSGPWQNAGIIAGASSGSASQSSTPDSSKSNSSNSASPGAGPTAQGDPFGQLYAQRESPTDPNGDNMSPISGSVTALSNDAPAASYLQQLDSFDNTLNSMDIPYNPLSTNSNAYVTNALQFLNVPVPSAPVWAPGSGTNLNVVPPPPPPPPAPLPPCSVAGAGGSN
ncbi:MAG: hypothetical protein ABSD20_17520, partial [Terriglobales bacterium]